MSKWDKLTVILQKLLNEWSEGENGEWASQDPANLVYAVKQIQPTNHQELAFVVACGSQHESCDAVVDDFIGRRAGRVAILPDHPLFGLQKWDMPDSQRILIYREQIEGLLIELTACHRKDVSALFYRLLRSKCKLDNFTKNNFIDTVCKEYRLLLSDNELGVIYNAIFCNIPSSRYYYWCSTIATRAEMLMK